jgi:hypothetical protein
MPNGHKIYQHFRFKGSPKYIQIGIFGFKSICTIWQPWLAYDLIKKAPSFCQEFAKTIVLDRDHTWFRIAMLSGHSHICTYICRFSVQSVTKGTERCFSVSALPSGTCSAKFYQLVGWLVNLASLAMFGWYRLGYFDPFSAKYWVGNWRARQALRAWLFLDLVIWMYVHTYVCMHVCMMLWLFTQGWNQL